MAGKKAIFINRELSWLEFNQRVLNEALDSTVPLLERLNFLAITASNLDEFFMVRVGTLETMVNEGVARRDPTGMTPMQQLKALGERVRRMVKAQYACYCDAMNPELEDAGIRIVGPRELSEEQRGYIETLFRNEVFPVVTPMATDPAAGLPSLGSLGLNVAVRLKPQKGARADRFAVIPVGKGIERFVSVPCETGHSFIPIEDVVRMFVSLLFPGTPVTESVPFRITRNADLSAQEDEAADFLVEMEQVLRERKQSNCVRLEVEGGVSGTLLSFLRHSLKVPERGIYVVRGLLDLSALSTIASMAGFESLRYKPWPSLPSPLVDPRKSIFDELTARDVLLVHPYDSFDSVLRLLTEAAVDPNVVAIKQTLYRTSTGSPVIAALKEAAERGKYVTAVVELKARFDEARNIQRARTLEEAGAQVIYGLRGLKTHAKVCIVVRREPRGVVRYVHFGTGNYNEKTARLYSDVSYMTSDDDLGTDATAFFNAITGYSEPQKFRKVEAAPIGLREKIAALIEGEAERKRRGQKALIMAKMNSLVDPDIIKALCKASQAGVKILLNVRGICCLRPGAKKLSDNITVVSIIDRFLEHSRIFYFHHGGEEEVYISSADWMPRNLDRRVELLVPIDDDPSRKRLIACLETYFKDTVKSSRLRADGQYERIMPEPGQKAVRSQEVLYRMQRESVNRMTQAKRRVFTPHLPPSAEST